MCEHESNSLIFEPITASPRVDYERLSTQEVGRFMKNMEDGGKMGKRLKGRQVEGGKRR